MHDLKMDRNIGRGVYGVFLLLAAGSSSATAGSLPIVLLDILPHWAELAMAGGGALFIPGSFEQATLMKRWLKQADQAIKKLESQTQPVSNS